MYKLSTESNDFEIRTKSVFDSLLKLEVDHKTKANGYIEISDDVKQLNKELNQCEIVEEKPAPIKPVEEFEFKVPEISNKRFRSPVLNENKKADYEMNPHKWRKYSLDDVKDEQMSALANYNAAMGFLKHKTESVEIEENLNLEFNKPFGGKKQKENQRKKILENLDEVNEDVLHEENHSTESKSETKFKKRQTRKNLRQKTDTIVEDERENEQTDEVNMDINDQNMTNSDDEFSNYKSEFKDESDNEINDANNTDLFN